MAGGDSKRIPIPTQRNDLRSDGNLPVCEYSVPPSHKM